MLPRLLSIILLAGRLILAGKLTYDSVIFQFWTTQWVVGTISTLVLISAGISLLFLSNKEFAYFALASFGIVYAIAALLIYISWGYQHISHVLEPSKYFGYLVLFIVVVTVSAVGLLTFSDKGNKKIFMFPAWGVAFANLGVIFMVVWKYVFNNTEWIFWPFVGELLVVVLGAIIFLISYVTSENL